MRTRSGVAILFVLLLASGCQVSRSSDDVFSRAMTEDGEVAWIRNGDAVLFEEEEWYPTDEIESLLENEVLQIAVYRDVPIYLDRADVRPFERLYTRFFKNRYRAFEKRQ